MIFEIHCTHCDEVAVIALFNQDDLEKKDPFCCNGCMTVYNIIHEKGLDSYYKIKSDSKVLKRRSPVDTKNEKFLYLDSKDFLDEYAYHNQYGLLTLEFYLEGIHCLACLWLVEKMPDFLDDVDTSRLDMGKSVASITLKSHGLFSNVARELNNLGYRPHPLKRNEEMKGLREKEDRAALLKIGIAGASAANTMLFADFLYGGADGIYAHWFSIMTVVMALPALLYSAIPFYQNAWNAIKTKTVSIDVPIAIAIILGLCFGLFNLLTGVHQNYLDSLTDLVFFLLLSRYFLKKIQEKGLNANDLNFFYQTSSVLKKEGENFIEIHPKYLKINDLIKVKSNEIIPADGVVVEGESSLNNSLLTGESLPQKVKVGDQIYSGTQNIDNELVIKIEAVERNSRIGKILKQVEDGWIQKAKIVELTNKVSQYFIIVVFLLAAILFTYLYMHGNASAAFSRSLTLLIVTCPCALALATPLALTHTLSKASKKGIIIKSDEVIEKLSQVKSVFLDKTGTITYGNLKVENFRVEKQTTLSLFDIIITLEQKSMHPVARALKEYAFQNGASHVLEIKNYLEILGIGVSGIINNHFYEIKAWQIFEDNNLIASFKLTDQIRKDSKVAITLLKKLGITPMMVSGDRTAIVNQVAQEVDIDHVSTWSEVTPEKKLQLIENSEHALMVGDGANDAMALSKAFVGVAVHGSMDISLRAADVYLTTPGISPLVDLIIISRETMKVIYRNLSISLVYNCFSVYAAYNGSITPFIAAIIMPISSLTILLSTLIGTKALNLRLRI
jgi:Cu2+-exporting ATPase/Cu+-exporting ATPase